MKNLLKYLILFIVAAASWSCADNGASAVYDATYTDISKIESTLNSSIFESESDPCLPRQISHARPFRVQNSARRTIGIQRHGLEYIKADRIVNIVPRLLCQRNHATTISSSIEPIQRLLYFGKLII